MNQQVVAGSVVESLVKRKENHVKVRKNARRVERAERRNLDVAVNSFYFIIVITSNVSIRIKKIYKCY